MVGKKKVRRINCEEAVRRLFVYIDDYLHGKVKDELEQHLEVCRDCFEKARFQKQFKMRMRQLKSEVPTLVLRKKVERILEAI
jgi:hypothetical protein